MNSTQSTRRRYGWLASIYDWANLEGLRYADARARAIELLGLRPGASSRQGRRLQSAERDARDATTERFALGWVTAAAGTSAAA